MECPVKKMCLGGDANNLIGYCEEGYRGMLCGSCSKDYTKQDWRTCKPCFNEKKSKNVGENVWRFFKLQFNIHLIQWLAMTYAETKNERYRNFLI